MLSFKYLEDSLTTITSASWLRRRTVSQGLSVLFQKGLPPSFISLKLWTQSSKLWSYSLSLLITGRSPPQVCKYSALNPSKENKRVGGTSNLDNEKEKRSLKKQKEDKSSEDALPPSQSAAKIFRLRSLCNIQCLKAWQARSQRRFYLHLLGLQAFCLFHSIPLYIIKLYIKPSQHFELPSKKHHSWFTPFQKLVQMLPKCKRIFKYAGE